MTAEEREVRGRRHLVMGWLTLSIKWDIKGVVKKLKVVKSGRLAIKADRCEMREKGQGKYFGSVSRRRCRHLK